MANSELLRHLYQMKDDIQTRLETDTALRMTGINTHSDYNLSEFKRSELEMELYEIEENIQALMDGSDGSEPDEF